MLDLRNSHGIVLPVPFEHFGHVPGRVFFPAHLTCVEPEPLGMRASLQIGANSSLLVGDGGTPAPRFNLQRLTRLASPELDGTLLDGVLIQNGWAFRPVNAFIVTGCLFYGWQDVREHTEDARRIMAEKAVGILHAAYPGSRFSLRMVDRRPATLDNITRLFLKGFPGVVLKYLPGRLDTREPRAAHWCEVRNASVSQQLPGEELQCSA